MPDELDQLRRTVYHMRYWCLLPVMVCICIASVKCVQLGYWYQLPGLLIAAGVQGVAWTTTGWLREQH